MENEIKAYRVRGGIGDAFVACCRAAVDDCFRVALVDGPFTSLDPVSLVASVYFDHVLILPPELQASSWEEGHEPFLSACRLIVPEAAPVPDVYVGGMSHLREWPFATTLEEPYVVIQPFTSDNKRGWGDLRGFSEVVAMLEDAGLGYVLVGGPRDATQSIEVGPLGRNYIGKMRLQDSIGIVSSARVVISAASWSAVAGASFGIPSLMQYNPDVQDGARAVFHPILETLGCTLSAGDAGDIENFLEGLL